MLSSSATRDSVSEETVFHNFSHFTVIRVLFYRFSCSVHVLYESFILLINFSLFWHHILLNNIMTDIFVKSENVFFCSDCTYFLRQS